MTVTKLIAPFTPFISEDIYQYLKTEDQPESVHLDRFPELTEEMKKSQDAELENRMRVAQQVVGIARSLRNNLKLKVRQPLSELIVASPSKMVRESVEKTAEIIKDEINVKEIKTFEKSNQIVTKRIKPLYKQLGPKVGKLMKKAAEIIENLNEDTVIRLEQSGEITLDIDGNQVHIDLNDVEFYEELKRENLIIEREGNILIGLNTHITAELEMEGIAREFINRIQNLRKEAGFDVTDRIDIFYEAPEKIRNAITNLSDYIMAETLALQITKTLDGGTVKKNISINGIDLIVSLKKK
jgi:isoleucyl-tRNA synthetase